MTRSVAIVLVLLLVGHRAWAASPEAAYLAARDEAIAKIKALEDAKESERAIQAAEKKALSDLANRLKNIIGPVLVKGFARPDKPNIALSQHRQDYGSLDGLASYGKGDQVLVVTRRALVHAWLEASSKNEHGNRQRPTDVAAAAREDDFYNGSLYSDVTFLRFAELPVTRPAGADLAVAALGELSQGFGSELPDTIVTTVVKGDRVFVAGIRSRMPIGKIRACEPLWATVKRENALADTPNERKYRDCFSVRASKGRFFAGLIKEAQSLVNRLAGA